MSEYIVFMHGDSGPTTDDAWERYFTMLRASGQFDGGSSIGGGIAMSRAGERSVTSHLTGYIRVRADSLAAAQQLVIGNPVYDAGGTIEIRELPRDT